MKAIPKVIRNNAVAALAVLVLVLIVLSAILVVENRKIMIQTTEQQDVGEQTLVKADFILNNLQAIDLGLRAYAITGDKKHLQHYKDATGETLPAFGELEALLMKQKYSLVGFTTLRKAMQAYIVFCDQVVVSVNNGDMETVKDMIRQDKGYEAWSNYQTFFKALSAFEKEQSSISKQKYDTASSSSIWIMGILLLVSIPTLSLIVYLLRRSEKKRKKLFIELEHNNRKYNFNSGEPINIQNEYQLVDGYIENSKKAADFVNHVAAGKYNVHWEGLNDTNLLLNQESLAGALVKMRDQMKAVKEEEAKRQWATKGLADFSELIRNNQEDIETLAYESIKFIVQYLNAQQGGFFVVHADEDSGDAYIEMEACFAFNKRKFVKSKLEIGEGLVGQAYLESDALYITDVPEGYPKITSGLGDATPKCVLVVPMKYNEQVQAIIELASFTVYEQYQLEFINKIGEFVASAVSTAKTNEITKRLLANAQQMAEELKSQEEEMRQNMEELSATQEEMHRKEKEYVSKIEKLEQQVEAKGFVHA